MSDRYCAICAIPMAIDGCQRCGANIASKVVVKAKKESTPPPPGYLVMNPENGRRRFSIQAGDTLPSWWRNRNREHPKMRVMALNEAQMAAGLDWLTKEFGGQL